MPAGTFIDHEIELLADGTSTVLTADEAPTVIVDAIPFSALQAGDKPVYVDVVGSVERLTRTPPSTNGTTTISSQGGSQTFELFPDLKSNLDLTTTSPQELRASVWVSRDVSSSLSGRDIVATIGFTGAQSGTIDTAAATNIQLEPGEANAQYLPLTFTLSNPGFTLNEDTALTLSITNNTVGSGESIIVHALPSGNRCPQRSFLTRQILLRWSQRVLYGQH